MAGNARIYDLWVGECRCHDDPEPMIGPIITASGNVKTNQRGQARSLDTVMGTCSHLGMIITSSPNAKCNGRGMARQFDAVIGCTIGIIITCSQNAKTN